MKKILVFCASLYCVAGIMAQGLPDRTIENLKVEYQADLTSAAKYAAYANKAKEEGYAQIAILFKAVSRSDSIHAIHMRTVMERLSADMDIAAPEYKVKSTAENLQKPSMSRQPRSRTSIRYTSGRLKGKM